MSISALFLCLSLALAAWLIYSYTALPPVVKTVFTIVVVVLILGIVAGGEHLIRIR